MCSSFGVRVDVMLGQEPDAEIWPTKTLKQQFLDSLKANLPLSRLGAGRIKLPGSAGASSCGGVGLKASGWQIVRLAYLCDCCYSSSYSIFSRV